MIFIIFMKDFLSIKETASLLGVTHQTLRNWEKKGSLVPYRNPINRYRQYRFSQVQDFLDEMVRERSRNGRFRLKIQSREE
jgi:DNA-binding transcriptional MerR regulator